jgi:hypothetical protein
LQLNAALTPDNRNVSGLETGRGRGGRNQGRGAVQVEPEEEMAEGVAAEIYISVRTHLLSGALYQLSTKRELQMVERDLQNNPIPGHQLDQACKYRR